MFFMPPLLILLALAMTLHGQTEPTFQAGVSLVRVDVQVLDRTGVEIKALAQRDFVVLDNGREQPIAFFGEESAPVDLLLLLDTSGSMSRSLQQVARAAREALQLREGDRAALMVFAEKTKVALPFTGDFQNVAGQIDSTVHDASIGGSTLLNEAIIAAAQYVRNNGAQARRAILIVTDNSGMSYKKSDDEVVKALLDADTVLNGILTRGPKPAKTKADAGTNPDFTPYDVPGIAERTGGEVDKTKNAGESLTRMVDRIRHRYNLQYHAPEGAPGFHHIEVRLSDAARARFPGAIVRARSGYFAAR
jgi:VWFA-related protein